MDAMVCLAASRRLRASSDHSTHKGRALRAVSLSEQMDMFPHWGSFVSARVLELSSLGTTRGQFDDWMTRAFGQIISPPPKHSCVVMDCDAFFVLGRARKSIFLGHVLRPGHTPTYRQANLRGKSLYNIVFTLQWYLNKPVCSLTVCLLDDLSA